ncbi:MULTISPECIES: hypothetical protein [Eikenella]|uniref:Uncharacterized protein n=1 Tax=Eikenella exigua TaxID=2528037 RepID=A0AAX1F9F8_9NEIS|nr:MULTISPECIES: hypothetical protein [Eikenella]QED92705.1 hypothetical protein EZJ17_08905 [Eikenella exigua]
MAIWFSNLIRYQHIGRIGFFILPKGVRLADGILASFPRDCLFGYGFLHLSALVSHARLEGYLKA